MTTITQARIHTMEKQIDQLRAENARLESALADTAAQLTDAVQRAQEAEYNLHLMTKQADANYHRAREAEASLVKYQTVTVARRCKQEIICDGDGDGPNWCKKSAEWEVQRMREDGSDYSYVCTDHLSDYQKWADEAGYSPLVFEAQP